MASNSTALNALLHQKLAVGFTTLIISLIFGLLPYHLSRSNDTTSNDKEQDEDECCSLNKSNNSEDPTMPPKWLSLATSFGGGVFLGAALLHLLPEASEVLDEDFPRANLFCSLGFLMVLALEEIMPHPTADSPQAEDGDTNSSSLALVAALSFHSLFDGLAIGSTTSKAQLKAVSIAILAHKPISAFALGSILVLKRLISLPQSNSRKNEELEMNSKDVMLAQDNRQKLRRLSSSRRSMAYYYFKYAHDECDNASCSKKECVCNDLLPWEQQVIISNGSVTSTVHENEGYGSCNSDNKVLLQHEQHKQHIKSKTDLPIKMIVYIVFFSTTSLIGTLIGALGLQYILTNSSSQQTSSATESESHWGTNDDHSSQLGLTIAAMCQSLAAGSFLYAATMEALVKETGDHHRHHYHHHNNEGENGTREHKHQTIERTNRVCTALVGVVAMAAIRMLEVD